MNYLEIAGTLIGLIYLYLEYKASAWLWIAGIVMPAVYLIVYYQAGLYADLGISIYYIIASVYGLFCWINDRRKLSVDNVDRQDGNKKDDGISHTPRHIYPLLALLTIGLTGGIGFILFRFTDSSVPWADAFTTALSIIAMWMLAQKYIEQWLVWIVADIGCAVLYWYKDLWFTGGLYMLYAIIAWFGYKKWKSL
ncbi:MAG: nicotinamide riboside transporter PnuC [Muribaculaceae bacterium]|nr:nicotinamide riboside transporter PnuC [Muribaculaceae bacterium]